VLQAFLDSLVKLMKMQFDIRPRCLLNFYINHGMGTFILISKDRKSHIF